MNKISEILSIKKYLESFVTFGEGNASIISNDRKKFLIKASGCDLFNMKKNDLVTCSLDCRQLNNWKKKPSIEVYFHAMLYHHNNINFILHTHPPKTLPILCSDKIFEFAESRYFPDQVVRNGKKSCVVPYGMPGEKLSEKISNSLEDFIRVEGYFPKLILLQNHGIICCGKTGKECLVATSMCEKSARIFTDSSCGFKIKKLSKKEIDEIFSDTSENYRENFIKQ